MEIFASILGGLVGGLFTFLGVLMTIRYENKKEIREEIRRQKEKEEQQFENRPRFDIVAYSNMRKYSEGQQADLSVLLCPIEKYEKNDGRSMFYYPPEIVDSQKWSSVKYTLKNIGHTEISHLFVSTNLPKNTALFENNKGENKLYYENHLLNYSVILDKAIKPKESIKLKVCYIDEQVVVSSIGRAPITIWLIDERGNWWSQPLFAPANKIYDCKRTSSKEWKDTTDEEKAIECFEKPYLW